METNWRGLLLAAFTFFILTPPPLFAEKPMSPPAPTPETVTNAQFGPIPDSDQISSLRYLMVFENSTIGKVLGHNISSLARPSGAPQKAYLYLPGSEGAPGTYQFGWAQAMEVDGSQSGFGNSQNTVLEKDYYYAFILNGKPAYYSRDRMGTCRADTISLRGRDFNDFCGTPKIEFIKADGNCFVPLPDNGNATASCSQIGTGVEMSSGYSLQGRDSTVSILPGMSASDVKRAGKTSGAVFTDRSPDSVILCDDVSLPGHCGAFLLRGGKVYARRYLQMEFPSTDTTSGIATTDRRMTPGEQILQLKHYKIGVTTLKQFYADEWNAEDAFHTRFGIIGASFDPVRHTVEFEIGSSSSKDSDLSSAAEASLKYAEALYDQGTGGAFNSETFGTGECHVRFIDGVLASITKPI
jgi:hypothetical protein